MPDRANPARALPAGVVSPVSHNISRYCVMIASVAERAPRASVGLSGDTTEALQAKFIRGLGDPTRLRIVRRLVAGPLSVTELMAYLAMPQSRVSNHLACLKWCGYVSAERRGKSVIYSVADERVRTVVDLVHAIVAANAQRIADCVRIGDS